MTVAELIEKLLEMPQDATVCVPVYEYGHSSEREVDLVRLEHDGDVLVAAS